MHPANLFTNKLFLALLACFVFPQTAAAEEKIYNDLKSLRAADPAEAIGCRVDFEAILTHVNAMQEFLFVQSGTDAIFVWSPKITSSIHPNKGIHVSQRVRVRGKVAKGDLLPIIKDAEVEVIGEGVLPNPEHVTKIGIEHDCRYLEFEYEILQTRIKFSSSYLYAKTKDNKQVTIEVLHPEGEGSGFLPRLVGERVKFPGVLGLNIETGAFEAPGLNKRNITGYKIFCESPSLLKTPAPLPRLTRSSIATKAGLSHILDPSFPDGRFLTFGQICLREETQPPAIILSEGFSFMRLEVASLDDLQTGMVMRIGGMKTTDSSGHANFKVNNLRDLAMAEFSQPQTVSVDQAIDNFKPNHRVSVTGSPQRIEIHNGKSILLLEGSDSTIAVEFQDDVTDSLSSIDPKIASQIQVTGIIKRDEKFGLKLTVARASDVTLLESKASISHIVLIGLAVLLVACSLAAIWIKLLRKQILQKRIFETIFDSVGCPIMVFNGDLQILDANQVAADMTGYSKSELQNLRVTQIDSRISREAIRAMLDSTMANQNVSTFPTQVVTKDKKSLDVEVHCRSLTPSDDLNKATFVAVFPDTTARNEYENKLKQARDAAINANKAKSRFVASMSHELRTPLNGVIGMTQLLENTQLTATQSDYLAACRTSGETLLTVIGDVLDFSKLEADKLELHAEETDLIPFIENIVRACNLQKRSQQVELGSYIDPQLHRSVMVDSDRLRQVLFNLVGNATKFTSQGSVILTAKCESVTEDYTDVRFVVSDTGIGIPKDRIKSLFVAFEQCDSSTTRQYGGTGLGLTISKRIVDLMEGKIHAESVQGKGSQFIIDVRLPFAKTKQTEDETLGSGEVNFDFKPEDLKNQKVAIVGTSGPILKLITEMYQQYQVNVTFFDESETIPKDKFDVVLFNSCNSLATAKNLIVTQGEWLTDAGPRLIPIVPASCVVKPQQWVDLGVEQPIFKPFSQSRLLQALNSRPVNDNPSKEPCLSLATLHDHQLRVLICEDVYVNQMFVKELCRSAGIDCVISENGKAGIQTLQSDSEFDAIFMDCHMPVMDGLEATQRIVGLVDQGMLPKIPIIALTANADSAGLDKCIAAGMDDYLTKPFMTHQFLEKIQKHLPASGPRKRKPAVSATLLINSDQIFNIEGLLDQIDDRDFVLDLARQFTETFPEYRQDLENSLKVQNAKKAFEVAHRIKGAAGIVQAERVRNLASEIETDANDGEIEQLQSQVEELLQEFDNFMNAYKKQESIAKQT